MAIFHHYSIIFMSTRALVYLSQYFITALCEKGSFSTNGLKPFTGCMKCPIGSYQNLDGQTFCEICPEGGQTTAEGAKHENECFCKFSVSFPLFLIRIQNVNDLQCQNATSF